jgi:hypothetical protein
MGDDHVPFRPIPLIVTDPVPSYIFPSCAPYDSKNQWILPPEQQKTMSDIHTDIEHAFGLEVYYTVSLRQKPPPSINATSWWFPLKGGPNSCVPPEQIQKVCDKIIAHCPSVFVVHCTHGLNRTLLILAALYLTFNTDRTVEDALHKVRQIRPPGILRTNVVDALRGWHQQRALKCRHHARKK